ncbi:hypothetical protein SprV_0200911700 [Sparganum proliferum]
MQDARIAYKNEEIQGCIDRNEAKNFFASLKAVHRCTTKGAVLLLSSYGTIHPTEISQFLKPWADQLRCLNRLSTVSDAAIDRPPQVETNNDLDLPLPLPETVRAVRQLSSGKTPGSDAIPVEVYKHGGYRLMDKLKRLFQEMWRRGQAPGDFKGATIVHLYKRKGNQKLYDNHRDISAP